MKRNQEVQSVRHKAFCGSGFAHLLAYGRHDGYRLGLRFRQSHWSQWIEEGRKPVPLHLRTRILIKSIKGDKHSKLASLPTNELNKFKEGL